MDRRSFLAKGSLAAGVLCMPHAGASLPLVSGVSRNRPRALSLGDEVRLVTPASAISRQQFEQALANVDALGLVGTYSDRLRVRKGFLAGTDAERLADLTEALLDETSTGVFCVRGGYGTMRLLSQIDYVQLQGKPKVLVGYSDITALHMALWRHSGWVGFHGPMLGEAFSTASLIGLQALLFAPTSGHSLLPTEVVGPVFSEPNPYVLSSGTAEGIVLGGNLSVLTALLGTPYFPDLRGCIVCLEEVNESPYALDRLLTQWDLAGIWSQVRGIALGTFSGCDISENDPDYADRASLYEVLSAHFSNLSIPVVYGLPFGHVPHNMAFPIGVAGRLDSSALELTFTESPCGL